MTKTAVLLGGDRRQSCLALQLQARGVAVRTCGVPGCPDTAHPLPACVRGAELLILPLPALRAPDRIRAAPADLPLAPLLAAAGPGELFAEAFACVQSRAPVSVLCKTDGRVLYLDTHAVFSPCEKGCAQHRTLSQNLIRVLAEKTMQLNEQAGYLSQRSPRDTLLAYLSAQARRTGSASFCIPFDRQQLADFLSVNRSAMSAELSKMQREGLLRAERSDFTLFQPE